MLIQPAHAQANLKMLQIISILLTVLALCRPDSNGLHRENQLVPYRKPLDSKLSNELSQYEIRWSLNILEKLRLSSTGVQ